LREDLDYDCGEEQGVEFIVLEVRFAAIYDKIGIGVGFSPDISSALGISQ